jgi:hypothetical protein
MLLKVWRRRRLCCGVGGRGGLDECEEEVLDEDVGSGRMDEERIVDIS